MYEELYNFCKVRDTDRINYSNRAKFLTALLDKLGIQYKIIRTFSDHYKKYFYNIYAFGSSDKFLSAHYDIIDIRSDNANDNSASVINMIAYKVKNPSVNILILDGEEPPYGGSGSNYASKYMKKNGINPKWILNLELTGVGNNFFVDNSNSELRRRITAKYPRSLSISTPFNDAMIFRQFGYDSCVLTTLNMVDERPDFSVMYHSHSPADSVDKMSTDDMKNFVENTLHDIVMTC